MYSHYDVLGVATTASKADIKKAYRKLSLIYHPDTNGGDVLKTDKYMQIRAAYENLMIPDTTRVHHQRDITPFTMVVGKTMSSSGDVYLCFLLRNILHGECIGKAGQIDWHLYGKYTIDMRIPKQFLIDSDYHFVISFTSLDGGVAVKEYRFDDPRSWWEKTILKLKTIFK